MGRGKDTEIKDLESRVDRRKNYRLHFRLSDMNTNGLAKNPGMHNNSVPEAIFAIKTPLLHRLKKS